MNGDDKLKKYDKEFRERENDKLQRQKENEFLRFNQFLFLDKNIFDVQIFTASLP